MELRAAVLTLALAACRRGAEPTAPPPAAGTATAAATGTASTPGFLRTPGRVAAGGWHTCVVSAAAEVWCFGANDLGQLGDGREVPSRMPVRVQGLTDVVAVTAGHAHTCARSRGGEVWCWGGAPRGEFPDRTWAGQRVPARVPGLASAQAVGAGDDFTCASTATGVWCWGDAPRGVYERNGDPPTATPVQVPGLPAADELCGSSGIACARTGGVVRCWGPNHRHGGWAPAEPARYAGLDDVVTMTCGHDRMCAARTDGTVACVGNLNLISIERSLETTAVTPWTVPDITGAVQLADRLVVGADGRVRRWGTAEWPVLTSENRYVLEEIRGIARPRDLGRGDAHACALAQDGRLRCWGDNSAGQSGGGGEPLALVPERIAGADGVAGLSAGNHFTCGVRGGRPWCWGAPPTTPGREGLADPVALGDAGVLDLRADDHGLCWRTDERLTCHPQDAEARSVELDPGVRRLLAHGCVLTDRGVVVCGPRSYDGRSFFEGEPADARPRPTDLVEVVEGGWMCGRRRGGRVACAKIGEAVLRAGEVRLDDAPLADAVQLAAAGRRMCAVRRGGRVACWDATEAFDLRARELPDLADIAAVFLRPRHACALRRDRTVVCWGANERGQLGDGTVAARARPVAVDLADVRELALADTHACARTGDGAVWCWGDHRGGARLAAAVDGERLTPTLVEGLPPL